MVNEKIINHIAGKFLYSGLAFEDLKSEATKFMIEETEKYSNSFDTEKNAWLFIQLNNRMKYFVRKELKWKMKTCDYDSDWVPVESQPTRAFEITSGFSTEAKQVCAAIFSAPAEYMGLMPKMARGKLVKQFRGEGWSWPTIWKVFNEIKSALN